MRITPEQKALRAAQARNRYANNDDVNNQCVARYRKCKYGLTPEAHAAMLEAQGGLCAICRGKGDGKGLLVDHCHETGVVRGLLCRKCNIGLGMLGDTPAGLGRAAKYLRDARKRQQVPLALSDDI